MRYRLLSPAAADLAVAIEYYERQLPGIGSSFLDEFEAAMLKICQYPKAWKQISPRHRRCLLRRFPFAVLYSIVDGEILVSGVMDLRANPTRQKERTNAT